MGKVRALPLAPTEAWAARKPSQWGRGGSGASAAGPPRKRRKVEPEEEGRRRSSRISGSGNGRSGPPKPGTRHGWGPKPDRDREGPPETVNGTGAAGLWQPYFKGFIRAIAKPFRCMFPCLQRHNHEDEDPDSCLPEVKISYPEEETSESLAAQSILSLMDDNEAQVPLGPTGNEKDGEQDSDSDACPAEAGPGPRSDSLEDIPEMLEAESLPSLMDNKEDKESLLGAAGKEKDGEKVNKEGSGNSWDYNEAPLGATEKEKDGEEMNSKGSVNSGELDINTCPMDAEGDAGPDSDRVEPQGTSDEECSNQVFDVDELSSLSTNEDLHYLCKRFPCFSLGAKSHTADTIARKHLNLMMEHFLQSPETACSELMYMVMASPHCNKALCLAFFMQTVTGGWVTQESEKQLLAKVQAIRGIEAIVRHLSDTDRLNAWLPYHFTTLAYALVSQFQPKEKGTLSKFKMYLVPGEVIDILAILLERLNLVFEINSKFSSK